MKQSIAHGCHQNVIEHSTTLGHRHKVHMINARLFIGGVLHPLPSSSGGSPSTETVPRIGLRVNPSCQQSLADLDDKTRPHERPAILEDEQGPWPVAPPYHVSQQQRLGTRAD